MTLRPRTPAPDAVRLSELLAALSLALDLTEGQPLGHAQRTALIALELAAQLDLPLALRRDLFHAALLKDVGSSSNAARVFALFGGDERLAKGARMRIDWTSYFKAAVFAMAHAEPGASWFGRAARVARLARGGPRLAIELVEQRCGRGGELVEQLGLGAGVAATVRALDEHWDGRGQPHGLRGSEVPLLARVLTLAQTLEAFLMRDGAAGALDIAAQRSGGWFDPVLVNACDGFADRLEAWRALEGAALQAAVLEAEPGDGCVLAGPKLVDRVAQAFAEVVDAKSPFTGEHSQRTTQLAVAVAHELGWAAADIAELRRAGLLHDLGKLTVPNAILDKPAPLTAAEWEVMRLHAHYTEHILAQVGGFEWLAFASASHHERLDGSGYCRGLRGAQVPELARVLAVADIYDALSTRRPYRPALEQEQVLAIMERDRDAGLCPVALDALVAALGDEAAEAEAA